MRHWLKGEEKAIRNNYKTLEFTIGGESQVLVEKRNDGRSLFAEVYSKSIALLHEYVDKSLTIRQTLKEQNIYMYTNRTMLLHSLKNVVKARLLVCSLYKNNYARAEIKQSSIERLI